MRLWLSGSKGRDVVEDVPLLVLDFLLGVSDMRLRCLADVLAWPERSRQGVPVLEVGTKGGRARGTYQQHASGPLQIDNTVKDGILVEYSNRKKPTQRTWSSTCTGGPMLQLKHPFGRQMGHPSSQLMRHIHHRNRIEQCVNMCSQTPWDCSLGGC